MKKTLIIIIFIIFIICITTGLIIYFNSEYRQGVKDMKNEKLIMYSYSSGGDMRGSHYSQEIKLSEEGKAVLCTSSADWYNDDPKTEESYIDAAVLEEIGKVFRKYHMNRWQNRKISKMFVADGASYSYRFTFGETDFRFSAQYYPGRYRYKLDEIDNIIEKYSQTKEHIPGLVRKDESENEDEYSNIIPVQGEICFRVYNYCNKTIYFRLLNGTDNNITFPAEADIIFNGKKLEVINSCIPVDEIAEDSYSEGSITLNDYLIEGTYRITAGDYSTEFEIK